MSEKHESKLQAKKDADDLNTQSASDLNTQSASNSNGGNSQQSRRKFIKGAAAATPIVLSVANRPVWARNCSLSGQLSGNLSNDDGIPCSGEGCSISFWAQTINYRSYHPKFPPQMLFSTVFGRNAFPGKTLSQVVSKNIANTDIAVKFGCTPVSDCRNALLDLGAQAVAALQNSASPVKYDLDLQTVILSFQRSFDIGTVIAMQETAAAFANFNNQRCPLPYAL